MNQKLIYFIFILTIFLPVNFIFAGTVLSDYKYAWSNNVGYINFENVVVSDDTLSGYAWSENSGWINLSPTQGGVLNDGEGNLSGNAWGEGLGWIDFDNVSISTTTGRFSGTATGDNVGIINFDCPNYCNVRTDWLSDTVDEPLSEPESAQNSSGGRRYFDSIQKQILDIFGDQPNITPEKDEVFEEKTNVLSQPEEQKSETYQEEDKNVGEVKIEEQGFWDTNSYALILFICVIMLGIWLRKIKKLI